MKETKNHNFRRLTWRKVTAVIGAVVATIAVVVGVYSTSMWAGTGYDYQGNEVAQALPVTKGASQEGNGDGSDDVAGGKRSDTSTARVFVKGNVDYNYPSTGSPKLEHVNVPAGAVNVVETTSYPQTGDKVSYLSIITGLMMLLGLVFIYRKKFTMLFHKA